MALNVMYLALNLPPPRKDIICSGIKSAYRGPKKGGGGPSQEEKKGSAAEKGTHVAGSGLRREPHARLLAASPERGCVA